MDPIAVEEWCVCSPRVWVRGGGRWAGQSGSGDGVGTLSKGGNRFEDGTGSGPGSGVESGKEYPPRAAKADMLPLWVCRVLGMIKGK